MKDLTNPLFQRIKKLRLTHSALSMTRLSTLQHSMMILYKLPKLMLNMKELVNREQLGMGRSGPLSSKVYTIRPTTPPLLTMMQFNHLRFSQLMKDPNKQQHSQQLHRLRKPKLTLLTLSMIKLTIPQQLMMMPSKLQKLLLNMKENIQISMSRHSKHQLSPLNISLLKKKSRLMKLNTTSHQPTLMPFLPMLSI
jgi:hypothetical protein